MSILQNTLNWIDGRPDITGKWITPFEDPETEAIQNEREMRTLLKKQMKSQYRVITPYGPILMQFEHPNGQGHGGD